MEPTMTSFLQALSIPSKITKCSIEILNPVHLISEGEKCEASQCALLEKLGIKPFSYGLVVKAVYDDGSMYDPKVLDITDEDILAFLCCWHQERGRRVHRDWSAHRCLSPILHPPCFANLLAVAVETEYTFKEAEQIKEFIANPEAFASAAPAAGASDAAAPAAEAKKESSSSEDAAG